MEGENTNKKSGIGFLVSWLVIGILLGAGGYYLYMGNKGSASQASVDKVALEQQNKILDEVSKVAILPSDETPTIFVINDAKTLAKDQPFYKDAIDQDVILVYQKTQKAVVFSPSRNLLVNEGPIILQNTAQQGTSNSTTTASATSTKKK